MFLIALLLGSARLAAADDAPDPCPHPSPLVRFDTETDVVRVRVLPGTTDARIGGVFYKVKVVSTLRGSIKPGTTMDAASGGPCAHNLVEGAEYVLPLGKDNTVGVGRVDGGTSKPLATSLALQVAIAKTKPDDVRAHAAVIYKAAVSSARDRASIAAYLDERPQVVAALTSKQKQRLAKLLGKPLP